MVIILDHGPGRFDVGPANLFTKTVLASTPSVGIAIGIAGGSPVTLRVGMLMVTLLCIGKSPIS